MPSSAKADLLDDGIVDTLVSVGATRLDNAAADSTDPHKRIHSHQLEYTVDARRCRRYGHINAIALCAPS
jgi:hypothetical protein